MKSFRYRFLAAALAVLFGTVIAKSQTAETAPPPPPMHAHAFGIDGHMIGFYIKELGITEDQQTQMKATLQKEHATLKPLMQQLHALDNQLKPYVEGTYDAAKVQSLVAAQSQALVQFKIEEARIHNELYQMLTSDQQAKLKEIEANRQARMQQHMQNAAPSQE
ncbi:MAG: Spy/CpxP family protein refolding chaperone [Candidatus Sulfotelmatobacter sp.]|jgi:protein CpxP